MFLVILAGALSAQTRNNQVVGLNAEISTMPKIVAKRLGANVTYLYSYKKFCAKAELCLLPNTNITSLINQG
jgi:hypothetical protein